MSNQPNQPKIDSLTAKRDDAALALSVAAKRFRDNASGPMADIYEMDMDAAFEALTVAGQDLREARDGYRLTHPRGCGHPGHAHCICHNAGALR
jgi:hypothetical protein